MSNATPTAELPPALIWAALSMIERRALGVLVEKNKTTKTPDTYPMTLNSLVIGCNQKTNRDPVLELDEDEVEETLTDLMKRGLTIKQQGGRVDLCPCVAQIKQLCQTLNVELQASQEVDMRLHILDVRKKVCFNKIQLLSQDGILLKIVDQLCDGFMSQVHQLHLRV